MPFPTTFPVTAIPAVVGYLRNAGVGRRTAAEAAYDLLGYAANIMIPENEPGSLFSRNDDMGDVTILADGTLADSLDNLRLNLEASPPNAAFTIPQWLVPVLLEVLRRVLSA